MARTDDKVVFFVGELPRTTHRLTLMTFGLCKKHAKPGSVILVNDLKSIDTALRRRNEGDRTFFINVGLCDHTFLGRLGYFGEYKAIVHVDLDDGSSAPQHKAASVLKMVNDVPIIQLTDSVGGDHITMIHWILRGLRDIQRKPVHPAIIEKALADNGALAGVTNHLPTRTLATA